jgi:N-acetylmuramoyl-L-alanine amidase
MLNIAPRSSPNFNDRNTSIPLSLIILHYTGMKDGDAALARLTDPKSEVSAHYVIEEDGRIFALVDEGKRAWHAGKSCWRLNGGDICDINSASIGIEIVNPGHQGGYRPFPDKQIAALIELLKDIQKRRAIPARNILGHSDIAPQRKEDPGELFPWKELAKHGLGLWPEPSQETPALSPEEIQTMLRAIGYDCPATGHYDRETRAVLLAFQRHYHPENLTGTPEAETLRRLKALQSLL